jgi:hypothetical protein
MRPGIEEKRRFPRVKLKSPVRYQIRGTSEFDNVVCDNISDGGIGFISNKFIPPSSLVMLEINVLARVLRPIGRIASSLPLPHSERNRLGVEFLEFENSEKNYLHDFIDMQLSR